LSPCRGCRPEPGITSHPRGSFQLVVVGVAWTEPLRDTRAPRQWRSIPRPPISVPTALDGRDSRRGKVKRYLTDFRRLGQLVDPRCRSPRSSDRTAVAECWARAQRGRRPADRRRRRPAAASLHRPRPCGGPPRLHGAPHLLHAAVEVIQFFEGLRGVIHLGLMESAGQGQPPERRQALLEADRRPGQPPGP
jgi:hypothetical protein